MKPALRVLAADDELLARKRLERLLGAMPGVEFLGACASAEELLARLEGEDCDVAVLDIQMPGLTGLEAGALLPDDGPLVIFVTAHEGHALEAFEIGAVDYVVKPVEAARLGRALERARRRLAPAAPAPAPGAAGGAAAGGAERLPLETARGVLLLDPAQITHVELEGALTAVVSLEQGRVLTEASLGKLGDKLAGFERVHRQALVNLARVRRLEPAPGGGYVAHLDGGAAVPVSRAVARRLRRRLGLL
ncbi:MAG TPA: LytTR family DNA-binding domain-containing protein [Polyangiaceae bacterium]|nr:LytTR family DNA-binding domain-containing protein [Polyangiaceae bacterium]